MGTIATVSVRRVPMSEFIKLVRQITWVCCLFLSTFITFVSAFLISHYGLEQLPGSQQVTPRLLPTFVSELSLIFFHAPLVVIFES